MAKVKPRHGEKPADFSFMKYKQLKEDKPDSVNTSRIGAPPPRGPCNKLLTKAIWLNNNKLRSMDNLKLYLDSVLENLEMLAWLDLSYNKLTEIDSNIIELPSLKILYLHGNNINDSKEIVKLKGLKYLKTLTMHGNPVYGKKNYRMYAIANLPQVVSLDFTRITPMERIYACVMERRVE